MLGGDQVDVGVGAGEHGVARVALAAAAVGHWSAAANAIAALERPEPGGPVKSHDWVIPWPVAAVCSVEMMWRWPTRLSQTEVVATFIHSPPG